MNNIIKLREINLKGTLYHVNFAIFLKFVFFTTLWPRQNRFGSVILVSKLTCATLISLILALSLRSSAKC